LGGPVDAACADAIVNDNYCGRVVPTLNWVRRPNIFVFVLVL
jgi:hypothetical protein